MIVLVVESRTEDSLDCLSICVLKTRQTEVFFIDEPFNNFLGRKMEVEHIVKVEVRKSFHQVTLRLDSQVPSGIVLRSGGLELVSISKRV